MTAIVGLVHENRVYIGGDSAGVAGLDLMVRADPKVFIVGEFVVGYTSSFRMGQLLRFKFTPPPHFPDIDVFKYMVTDVVEAFRTVFKDGGYATKDKEQESGGQFLVGYRGRLFTIGSDYQVGEPLDKYAAVGCGDNQALGVMYATAGLDWEPAKRVKVALQAAERHSAGVRAPFTIAVQPDPPMLTATVEDKI